MIELILLILASLLIYLPCLKGEFLFDDIGAIQNSETINTRRWKLAARSEWRSLALLSWIVDSAIDHRIRLNGEE